MQIKLLGAALALIVLATPAVAVTFTVNTTDADAMAAHGTVDDADYNTSDADGDGVCDVDPDPGDQQVCTLRAAIQQANTTTTFDTIEFDNGITEIVLETGLPSIDDDVNIKGRKNGDGDPEIVIDGDGNGGFVFSALAAAAEGSSIVDLVIHSMSTDGITLDGTPYILDNLWIGVDASGNTAMPNGTNGILVQFSTDSSLGIPTQTLQQLIDAIGGSFADLASNAVAALPALQALFGNDNLVAITNSVLSGNDESGLRISGGLGDTGGVIFAGNKVGTNADGDAPVPNGTANPGSSAGVHITANAYLNAIIGNVIAANQGDGVLVEPGAVYWPNLVGGNFVGLPNPLDLPNPLGITAENWGHYDSGIRVESAPDPANPTDYAAVVAANVVVHSRCGLFAGNNTPDVDAGGIAVTNGAISSNGVIVSGNLVGVANFPLAPTPLFQFGNQCDGINVSDGANQIGGPNGADANVIGANAEHGILLRNSTTAGNTIQGNLIGRDPTNSTDTPNGGHGIFVNDSGGNVIGGPGNLDRNVIAHNGGHGIKIFNNTGQGSPNAYANLMQRNQIFDNALLGIDLDDPQDAVNQNQADPANNTALDPVLTDDNPHAYANFRQNAPQMTGAGYSGGEVTVSWSLASADTTEYRIEAFAITPDGAEFLGEKLVTTDTDGLYSETNAPIPGSNMADDPRGKTIVMTATALNDLSDIPGPVMASDANNTSEFSNGIVIPDEIRFSAADYPVNEGATATITLQRIGTGSGAVQVTVSLADTSTEPADHGALAPSATVTWANGETGDKSITLATSDDAVFEGAEVATLDFAIDSGTAVEIAPNTATVTIADNDPMPTLTIAGSMIAEGGQLVWTVTRNGATEQTVTANYAVTAALGTEAADFAAGVDPLAGAIAIAANDTTATISVLAVDDTIDEADEDVMASLSAPSGATLAGGGTAAATITDNDAAPTFAIDSPSADETDADAPIVFTVTRTGDTELASSVDYVVAPGTATTPEDYLGAPDALSGTLAFAAAQPSATITLTVVGDTDFEPAPPEQFTATLSNPTNATVTTAVGTATLTDNDPPQPGEINFTAMAFQANETEAAVDAVVTVTRTGGTDGPAGVDCVASAGTATAGDDFTAGNVSVNWAADEGGSKQCLVPIAGDVLDEDDETVLLALANASGATIGNLANATLTIVDNDALPAISLAAPSPTAEGDAGDTAFVFTATLSAASGRDVMAVFSTSDGSATLADNDYQMVDQVISIPAGSLSVQATVNVVGDTTDEADETFNATLSEIFNATPQDMPETASAVILNDDAPPPPAGQLRFTSATYSVGENGVTANAVVERVNGAAGAVSVDCTAGAGTAGAADATLGTQAIDFADGDAAPKNCVIPIADDALDEDDETVLLALSNPTNGATLDAPSAATLTITDDDAAPVVSIADVSLPEGDGPAATAFAFDVTLSAPSGRTVTVQVATGGGTASVPGDYAMGAGTVTFAPGVVAQSFAVNVVGDTTDEGDDTFDVTLSAPVNATLAADPVATGTIVNDDAPAGSLQFGAATYSIGEAGVQATIVVTRTGGTAGAVGVQYGTANGTATAGADYTATAGALAWSAGDATPREFTVPIANDAADEPDETVLLALSQPTGGATLGVPVAATLTITDDDEPAPAGTLQFSAAGYSVGEAGVQATITVTRTGGSAGAISVQYASSNGTATAGSDYTAAAGTLDWADADAAAKTFTVLVAQDATDEPDETVILALSAPTGGSVLGVPAVAVLTITDDDAPGAGSKTFNGPSPTGSGPVTVTFVGGGDPCGFTGATQFGQPPQPLPAPGIVFPHGVLSSTIANCTAGASLTVTATYPQALPAGTQLWKYGRTANNPVAHWYVHPATINGNTVVFSLVDGGAGDDDLAANGTIVDPVGPAFLQGGLPAVAPITIPATGERVRIAMMLLLGLAALLALRPRR